MRRIVLVIVVVVVAGAVLYSMQTPVDGAASLPPSPMKATPAAAPRSAVLGTGEVAAEADVLPVSSVQLNLTGAGIVAEVLVKEGDTVKKDQVLVRLDATRQTYAVAQAQAAFERVKAAQAATQATLARTQAVLAQLKAGPRPEDVAVSAAAVNVVQAQLARSQAGADTTALATAKANEDKAARAVQQAQAAYDRMKDTPFGNIGPEALRLEQTTIDYDLAKTAYEQLQLGPREVDINVVKAQLAQAQAALAQVQLGARPEAIAAAEADVAAASANAKATDSDIASATAGLKAAQDALADTELHTPFDGTVVSLNVKAGEAAPVGSFAVRVADLSQWKIQTRDLTELAVSRVKVGAVANIKFDGIPDANLTGKVSRIDQFGTNRQGDIVYAVTVTPDTIDPRMRWNMTASVNIQP